MRIAVRSRQHTAGKNGETKNNKSECGDSLHKKTKSLTQAIIKLLGKAWEAAMS